MEKFNNNSKYGDIVRDKAFDGFQYMIDFRRPTSYDDFDNMTLKDIENYFSWDSNKMVDSANYLYECQTKANVFYDIDSKNCVGIAAITKKEKSKFVLICPGGGYSAICAITEGYNLARELNNLGFSAFVLSYRVGKSAAAPNPQDDIAKAVEFIVYNAEKFNIYVDDYIVMGFSAGAHVVGCFGTKELGYQKYSLPKPKMLVLGYPVITMGEFTHKQSRELLLGVNPDKDTMDKYSIEKNITSEYPNTYLWQCKGDPMVPFENSQNLAKAFEKENVNFKYEVFLYEAHGLPIGATEYDENWLLRALDFYNSL